MEGERRPGEVKKLVQGDKPNLYPRESDLELMVSLTHEPAYSAGNI